MCPSDIIEVEAGNGMGYGPAMKVFQSAKGDPCSIHVLNRTPKDGIQIQIKRDDTGWVDYEEGQLIIGTTVNCRLRSNNEQSLMIEVFHN